MISFQKTKMHKHLEPMRLLPLGKKTKTDQYAYLDHF